MSDIAALLDEAALRLSAADERDTADLDSLQQRLDTLAELLAAENGPRAAEATERAVACRTGADAGSVADDAARSLEELQAILEEETGNSGTDLPAERELAPAGPELAERGPHSPVATGLQHRLGEQLNVPAEMPMLNGFLVTEQGQTLLAQFEQAWCDYTTTYAQAVDLVIDEEFAGDEDHIH